MNTSRHDVPRQLSAKTRMDARLDTLTHGTVEELAIIGNRSRAPVLG
jgi:hypothetical protein